MFENSLFKKTFILLFVVGFLNYIASVFYLYWTVWWFNMVMHFLSGGVVTMTTFLILRFFRKNETFSRLKIIFLAIASVFIVGIAWEIFELSVGLTSFSDGIWYVLDTVSDLILDLSGGFLGIFYALRSNHN